MPRPGGTSVSGCRGPQGNHLPMGTVPRIWGMICVAPQPERWESHTENTEVPWHTASDTKGHSGGCLHTHTHVPATRPAPGSLLWVASNRRPVGGRLSSRVCLWAPRALEVDGGGRSAAAAGQRLVRPSAATVPSAQPPEDPGVPADCPGPLVTHHARPTVRL